MIDFKSMVIVLMDMIDRSITMAQSLAMIPRIYYLIIMIFIHFVHQFMIHMSPMLVVSNMIFIIIVASRSST